MTPYVITERTALTIFLLLLCAALVKWIGYLSRRRVTEETPQTAEQTFDATPDGTTLLYFWSEGCAQCAPQERQIARAREIAERSGRQVNVVKLNALEEGSLASSFHVMTVPTTVLLDAQGKVSAWNPGLTPSEKLVEQLKLAG